MGAALALSEHADVTLFEQDQRFGGHAHTVDVEMDGRSCPVDTGFIVYNERNYPNLTGLFDHLGVRTKLSDMSFGLSVADGQMEYACDDLDRVFAQRSNLVKPSFLIGLWDIVRFTKTAPGKQDRGELSGLTLRDWMDRERYSEWFRACFVQPFGGAIWSAPPESILEFPADNFVSFFRNHDLMNTVLPMKRWRTVDGGSREYVSRLIDKLGSRAVTARVMDVSRAGGRPSITFHDGSTASFDHVILACHAPQAATLLRDMDVQERTLLGQFETSSNTAFLHSDTSLMPRRRKVWSSWNFLASGRTEDAARPAPVTYWMNRLQGIDPAIPLFVSLNPQRDIDEKLVHRTFDYAHPVMSKRAFEAQAQMPVIQGRGGIWYAGAWLGYGFHEDGLVSGLTVAASLGANPAWAKDMPKPTPAPLAVAAE